MLRKTVRWNPQNAFNHDLKDTVKKIAEKYNDKIYLTMDPYDIGAVYYDWDDKAIQLLKDCLDEASAKIVISSGWRDFNNEEKLKALFKIHDLDSYIIDVLPKENKETVIADYLRNAGCIATTSAGRNAIDKYPLWSYYNK